MICLGVTLLAAFVAAAPVEENPLPRSTEVCHGLYDGYYQLKDCSRTYWECKKGVSYVHMCKRGYYFNRDSRQCKLKSTSNKCKSYKPKPDVFRPGPAKRCCPRCCSSCKYNCKYAKPKNFSNFCSKAKDGYYTEYKCDKNFIKCEHKKLSLYRCPEKYYFDHHKKTCVKKEYVHFCKHDGSKKPQSIGFIPAIGVVASLLSSASSINNLFFDTASSVAEYCMDKPAGLYNDLKCERVYIECYGNQTGVGKACHLGYVFDDEKGVCAKKEDVHHCNDAFDKPQDIAFVPALGVAASLLSGASSIKNLFFSDPAELNKYCKEKVGLYSDVKCEREYIECFANKTGLVKSCPLDYIFNDEKQVCAKREDVKHCEDAFTKPQDFGIIAGLGVAASLLSGASSVKNLFFSDPAKLNKYCMEKVGLYSDVKCERDYIECFANKTGLVKSCPMDKIFDDEKRACVYKESVQYCNNAVGKPQDIGFIPALGLAASLLSSASSINNLFFVPSLNVAEFCLNRAAGRYSEVKCEREYIECYADKTGEVKICPFDQIFDEQKGLCVALSSVVDCKGSVAIPELDVSCKGMLCSTPAVNSTVACLELTEGFHEMDQCSPYFVYCSALASKMYQCPDPLIFDPVTKKCVEYSKVDYCRFYDS